MIRAAALLCLFLAAAPAGAGCRQALALGLDVSGSVDSAEYRLQLDGLAGALAHPEVAEALLALPDHPVEIAIFEWSGPTDQRLLQDWTPVTDAAALARLSDRLRGTGRAALPPSTALGAAKRMGATLLARRPACWKRTLDISGDGMSNTGPRPRDVHLDPTITVNGLVIGSDDAPDGDLRQTDIAALSSYYTAYVIQGPDAFVETALGFADFEAAMVRKLKRELQGLTLASDPASPAIRTMDAYPARLKRIAARSPDQ